MMNRGEPYRGALDRLAKCQRRQIDAALGAAEADARLCRAHAELEIADAAGRARIEAAEAEVTKGREALAEARAASEPTDAAEADLRAADDAVDLARERWQHELRRAQAERDEAERALASHRQLAELADAELLDARERVRQLRESDQAAS